jgi:hypothetical protein
MQPIAVTFPHWFAISQYGAPPPLFLHNVDTIDLFERKNG